MVAAANINMTDIARQKRLVTNLDSGGLTPGHTVGQAVDYYRTEMRLPGEGLQWAAFSRGVKLDHKRLLQDLPDEDTEWTVMPEVSAGAA